MPTVKQLRYFVAVADLLSFGRAAEACNVSQPTLSVQIQELEKRLGVQLVERSRHRVLVTGLGKQVARRAREVLRGIDGIVDLAQEGRTALGRNQRLGILPSLGPYLLPHILPPLRDAYPGLALYLREDTTQNLIATLEDGALDVAIVPLPLPVQKRDLEATVLFDEPLWLALPRRHRLAEKAVLRMEDLRGEGVLTLEAGHSLHSKVLELCDSFGAQPHLEFAATSLDTLRQMTVMGLGSTFLPAFYVLAEALDDEEIAVRPFEKPAPHRRIGLTWRRRASGRVEYLAFAKRIRAMLAEAVPGVVSVA